MMKDLCALFKFQSVPVIIDTDVFSGNPLDYQYFITSFHKIIEKKVDDSLGRLALLIWQTKGDAKDIIQHCIQMTPPEGYKIAKMLLKREYGDLFKNNNAYMKELSA